MTPFRGGKRRAVPSNITSDMNIERFVITSKEAQQEGVDNLPKVRSSHADGAGDTYLSNSSGQVIFTDRHGHRVAHNPQTLRKQG
jgi:hypothetical protein